MTPYITSHAIVRFVERFGQTGENTRMIQALFDRSKRLTRREVEDYGQRTDEWSTTQFWATPYRGYIAVFVVRSHCIVSVLKLQPLGPDGSQALGVAVNS